MTNIRTLMSPTPEGRLAAVFMRVLRHFASMYGRSRVMDHIDHRDFQDELREEIRAAIGRELLLARLDALQVPPERRELEKRKAVVELSKILADEKPPGESAS